MPTAVEVLPKATPPANGLPYEGSIKSNSTVESEVLTYIPEIILNGSSNEAIKGERAVMDATDEESFTLDTFDRLIRKAYGQGKSFLLARVTTEDPHDPDRLYHSYYSAHHINKVLFRTQPELSLLHRMKSQNPLNNMPIVGDVDFYIIDPKSVEKAIKQLHIETKKDEFSKPELSKVGKKHRRTMSDTNYRQHLAEESRLTLAPIVSYQSSIHEMTESTSALILKPSTEGERKRIQYEATFFATDDDFLMKNEVREVFKKHSLNPDDYMLFTLHANSQIGPNGEIFIHEGHGRPARPPGTFRNLWGCINTEITPSLTNRFTGFITNRGLAVFFALYLIGAIVALKLLIPPEYIYLCGFLFAFVFVLVLVLFVEAGPR